MRAERPTGPTILLAFGLPPELRAQVEALAPAAKLYSREDLESDPELLSEVEIVYGHLAPEEWPRARSLAWVQTAGAGVDYLMTPEVRAHPALLTNVHIHGEGIAEHLFGMVLMLTRGLQGAVRQQVQHVWGRNCANDQTLPGQTLGVLGLGAIGGRAAELGAAFGMRVLGLRKRRQEGSPVERVYMPEERLEMLGACHVVMNTLPLTEETRRFLGPAEFAALPAGALVFNVGRGGTMDTEALVAALQSGHLGGAGLDVTDPEPLPPDHPLWDMENVIITPHCSGGDRHYAEKAGTIFVENLRRFLAGQPLANLVDKRAGY